MRTLISAFAAMALASSAQAASFFSLTDDHAFFSILSGNNLSFASSTVNGNAGTTNITNGSWSVDGEVHFRGAVTCSTCGTATGGLLTNSSQYLDSLAAWSALVGQMQALPATGSNGLLFGSSATLTSGIWNYSTVLLDGSNTLSLDAQGDPDAQFVIRANMFLMQGSSDIRLLNGAQATNVLIISGNTLLNTSSGLEGMLYSTGPLTRENGSADVMTLVGTGNLSYSGVLQAGAAQVSAVPEPASALLLLGGGAVLLARRRARR